MLIDKTTVSFIMSEIGDLIGRRMKEGKRKKQNSTDEIIGAVGRFILSATKIKNPSDNDLVARCQEILAWKSTGILEGEVLRSKARALQEKFPLALGEALTMAENQTFEECMKLIVERFSTPPVELLPGTVVPSNKDGMWTYTLRVNGKEVLAEDTMLFYSIFASAAEAKQAMREKCGITVG